MPPEEGDEEFIPPLQALQGDIFKRVDDLEKVKLDEEEKVPDVYEVTQITEYMSNAITDVRNQFRFQLTNIIEATASLFEHLVILTKGIDQVNENHEKVMGLVREANAGEAA